MQGEKKKEKQRRINWKTWFNKNAGGFPSSVCGTDREMDDSEIAGCIICSANKRFQSVNRSVIELESFLETVFDIEGCSSLTHTSVVQRRCSLAARNH